MQATILYTAHCGLGALSQQFGQTLVAVVGPLAKPFY